MHAFDRKDRMGHGFLVPQIKDGVFKYKAVFSDFIVTRSSEVKNP